MCGLGPWELLIVLGIVVLLFGASRLPQLGKALGETVSNFKKGQSTPKVTEEDKNSPIEPAHEVAQLVESDDSSDEKKEAEKKEA